MTENNRGSDLSRLTRYPGMLLARKSSRRFLVFLLASNIPPEEKEVLWRFVFQMQGKDVFRAAVETHGRKPNAINGRSNRGTKPQTL